jgi:ribonuclease P protein component
MAVIVGRRFGLAVRRNRAKRVFRELGRAVWESLKPGYDFLVFPKREALSLPHDRLQQAWNDALRRQGIMG